MAQLKDSIVTGSLRVTDTTYTNNLIINNTTAPTIATSDYLLLVDASDSNRVLKGPELNTSNTTKWLTQAGTWTTPTAANVGAAPSAGANTIVTVGTVTSGTWNATIIGVAYGGTGAAKVNKNLFFAGSSTTDNTAPSWRKIAAADLPIATASAVGGISVSTGLSVTAAGALSVSYGTAASTALQGNQTLFKLNNADKTASSAASFYAPTGGGTAGHILVAAGATSTPTWSANAYIIDESGSSVANKRNELVLGNATASSSNGSSFGRLALYSENTAGTYLIAANGTSWKTATLPAATGMLAMIESSTAKGSDTKPVKVAATGLITECSTYAGGTKITLNGTDKGANTANIYAATGYGAAGYVLNAAGENSDPTWVNRGNGRIFYGTCTTAAGTVPKVVTCTQYDSLQEGDIIVVKFSATNTKAVASTTMNVNGTGALAVKKLYNAAIANLTAAGEINKDTLGVFMYSISGTTGYWVLINADYNNTYSDANLYSAEAANRNAETEANGGLGLHRYSLEMMTANLTWSSIASAGKTAIANTTSNDKIVSTAAFLLDSPIYYQSTNTHCAPGGAINVNGYTCVGLDLRYSCGTTSNNWTSLTVQKPVYLIGTVHSTSTFKLDSSKWWGQTLPNSNDGKIYIYLGMSYGSNSIYLAPYHPIYWHDGTSLRVYTPGTQVNLNGTDKTGAVISIYAPTASGTSGYILQSNGENNAPSWIQATDSNTASTIVKRDENCNFSAGTITASLTGHASLDLALSGGTMTGTITGHSTAGTTTADATGAVLLCPSPTGNTGIFNGNGDGVGRDTANLIIKSWCGIGFVDGCTSTANGMTLGMDCRNGNLSMKGNLYYFYNNTWYPILKNHNNGNIALNACGGGAYIGSNNTTETYFIPGGTWKLKSDIYRTQICSRYAAGSSPWSAGLMIREVDECGDTQSSIDYAPKLGFHWSNRTEGVLTLESDSIFKFRYANQSYAPVWTGTLYAGNYVANTAADIEYDLQCRGGAGIIYLYSQAATNGARGIYGCNTGGTYHSIVTVDSSNNCTFHGHSTGDIPTTLGAQSWSVSNVDTVVYRQGRFIIGHVQTGSGGCSAAIKGNNNSSPTILATLPVGYRPLHTHWALILATTSSTKNALRIGFWTNGQVKLDQDVAKNTFLQGEFCFCCEQY